MCTQIKFSEETMRSEKGTAFNNFCAVLLRQGQARPSGGRGCRRDHGLLPVLLLHPGEHRPVEHTSPLTQELQPTV